MTAEWKIIFGALESGGDEAAPVERMGTERRGAAFAERGDRGGSYGAGHAGSGLKAALIETEHPLAGGDIFDWPKATDNVAGSGGVEGAPQTQ